MTVRISVLNARNGTISAQALVHNRTMAGYFASHVAANSAKRSRFHLLRRDEDPQDLVDQELAARDHKQDQGDAQPGAGHLKCPLW
jgi:hypothetical protein